MTLCVARVSFGAPGSLRAPTHGRCLKKRPLGSSGLRRKPLAVGKSGRSTFTLHPG